jgi:hypothetical protein
VDDQYSVFAIEGRVVGDARSGGRFVIVHREVCVAVAYRRFVVVALQPVEPGQEAATFTVELEAGPAVLETWLDDAAGRPICGAYYVYVSR